MCDPCRKQVGDEHNRLGGERKCFLDIRVEFPCGVKFQEERIWLPVYNQSYHYAEGT